MEERRLPTLNVQLQPETLVLAHFTQEALRRRYLHVASSSWPTTTRLDTLAAAATFFADAAHHAYLELDRGIALAVAHFGSVVVYGAGETADDARVSLDHVRELLPATEPSADETLIPVVFWSASMHGPSQIHRELTAPSWSEIADNYPDDVRSSLEGVMSPDFRPDRGGQLLLWHGETGTGKTTALRALAREWREWCALHYITDPEKFFGEMADYMLEVMLQGEMGFEEPDTEDLDEGVVGDAASLDFGEALPMVAMGPTAMGFSFHGMIRGRRRTGWRLLVLEDAGELLAADARAATGQGLSRFLNAVDGLIGQGLRFLILVTTNEELGRLHPAVARPGRAAMKTQFKRLSKEESRAWLEGHGAETADVDGAMTLASLYARLEGLDQPQPSRPLGFRS